MTLKRFSGNLIQKPAEGRPRILYVEDEDANWDVASARLRAKYDLMRASDADSAFALLMQHTFDLILMDIELANSRYDGIEITRILKGTFDKPLQPAVATLYEKIKSPIIFVTAYTARYSKDDLRSVGGDETIAKPVDFTQLSLAITRLIARGVHSE